MVDRITALKCLVEFTACFQEIFIDATKPKAITTAKRYCIVGDLREDKLHYIIFLIFNIVVGFFKS
jgi:hypothetical protein